MTGTLRNNVRVSGRGDKVMLFAQGFGCDEHVALYGYEAAEPFSSLSRDGGRRTIGAEQETPGSTIT